MRAHPKGLSSSSPCFLVFQGFEKELWQHCGEESKIQANPVQLKLSEISVFCWANNSLLSKLALQYFLVCIYEISQDSTVDISSRINKLPKNLLFTKASVGLYSPRPLTFDATLQHYRIIQTQKDNPCYAATMIADTLTYILIHVRHDNVEFDILTTW